VISFCETLYKQYVIGDIPAWYF